MAVIAREFRLFVRNTMLSVALKLVFSSDCSTDQLGMQSICFALLCTLVFLNILEGQFSTRFLYGSVPEDWRSSFSNFFFHREMIWLSSTIRGIYLTYWWASYRTRIWLSDMVFLKRAISNPYSNMRHCTRYAKWKIGGAPLVVVQGAPSR